MLKKLVRFIKTPYRKYMKLEEYSVYCFKVDATEPKINLSESRAIDKLVDDWIDLIEALNLECGGCYSKNGLTHMVCGVTYKANPNNIHKRILKEWLDNRFSCVKIGEYENAWYPDDICDYKGE